jgi:hypothetical protein
MDKLSYKSANKKVKLRFDLLIVCNYYSMTSENFNLKFDVTWLFHYFCRAYHYKSLHSYKNCCLEHNETKEIARYLKKTWPSILEERFQR